MNAQGRNTGGKISPTRITLSSVRVVPSSVGVLHKTSDAGMDISGSDICQNTHGIHSIFLLSIKIKQDLTILFFPKNSYKYVQQALCELDKNSYCYNGHSLCYQIGDIHHRTLSVRDI